jgi:hypothetical protein
VINPLRSEGEAFRFFLWVLGVVAAVVLVIIVLRAVL